MRAKVVGTYLLDCRVGGRRERERVLVVFELRSLL